MENPSFGHDPEYGVVPVARIRTTKKRPRIKWLRTFVLLSLAGFIPFSAYMVRSGATRHDTDLWLVVFFAAIFAFLTVLIAGTPSPKRGKTF